MSYALFSRLLLLDTQEISPDVLALLDELLEKQFNQKPTEKRKPVFGSARGTFIMADDFDEPLEDFKDYM